MINNTPSDIFRTLNPNSPTEATRSRDVSDMGSDDFLALMIAQMKNQDPTKPMDQMAFLSQLAQFGTLSGVQELNGSFGQLSTNLTGAQAVQASSLVAAAWQWTLRWRHWHLPGAIKTAAVNLLSASVDMGAGSDGGIFEVETLRAPRFLRSITCWLWTHARYLGWRGV